MRLSKNSRGKLVLSHTSRNNRKNRLRLRKLFETFFHLGKAARDRPADNTFIDSLRYSDSRLALALNKVGKNPPALCLAQAGKRLFKLLLFLCLYQQLVRLLRLMERSGFNTVASAHYG